MNAHTQRLLTIATATVVAALIGAALPPLLTEPQYALPVDPNHQHHAPSLVVVPPHSQVEVQ